MLSAFKKRALRLMLLACCGGTMLQATSCSPGVRDSILQGLQTTSTTLTNILIQALFEGLGDDGTGN